MQSALLLAVLLLISALFVLGVSAQQAIINSGPVSSKHQHHQHVQQHPHGLGQKSDSVVHHGSAFYVHHTIKNSSLAGVDRGCKFQTTYFVTANAHVQMCVGHSDQDMKNGMSIINLIGSRGYLPTCRVMHLMLWMASQANERGVLAKEFFVDIGSNIGSCSVHMAALGFPAIAVEPVKEHVATIQGSIDLNPAFHIDLQHIGLSSSERSLKVNFGHGSRNWGASEFHEVAENATFEAELTLKTLDHVIGHRKVALLKIDCEGCEWETLKSSKRVLKRIPMIKLELVQPEYTAGNETMTPYQIVQYLDANNYDLFYDHWNEQHLYFGRNAEKTMDIDFLFGSARHKLAPDEQKLRQAAQQILREPIAPLEFNHRSFLRKATDIIAIERSLSDKMKQRFLS